MFHELWTKTICIQITLHAEDVANENQPLPLIIEVPHHHYLGMYSQTALEFFYRFLPFPFSKEELWFELIDQNLQLSMTDIFSNILTLYKPEDKIIKMILHCRKAIQEPQINLMDYYKHQLKASTCIRNKRQGATMLLSEFSMEQFNDLYQNFKANRFQQFMQGELYDDQKIGFKKLMQKQDAVPLVMVTIQGKISRQYDPSTRLSSIKEIFNNQELEISLLGVQLKDDPKLSQLIRYVHPDGFLYLVIND